jgi:hypothetical protein
MYISKTKISYPITLNEDILFIKRTLSLELNDTEDDDFINTLIQPATELTEGVINQDIALTNNIVKVKDFSGTELVVTQGNFNAITSIVNNDASTLITTYSTEKNYSEFKIVFDSAISCKTMTINFTTGWTKLSELPRALYLAILVKTCDIYRKQRNSYIDNFSKYESTWESMCQQYKLL